MQEKMQKRLAKLQERKLLEQEQSEKNELKRPEKIIRRAADPGITTLNQQGLRQKKG